MRVELLEGRLGTLEKDLLQATDTRRHEGSEAERRLQIITKECEQERSRGKTLTAELDTFRTDIEYVRNELHVANQEKEVQVGLVKKQMDMCSAECLSKLDIKSDLCERTLSDFRKLMTDQQRKAAHRIEELRVSVMRMERERDNLRQEITYIRESEESAANELLQSKKDKQTLARQTAQLKSRLETVEKNAYSEEDRANGAELQVIDLLSKQETIMSELSLARQARDQSELGNVDS